MITESIEAWLLHKRTSGESSLYITLYTRELGLVTALYKGGRAKKKQGLQPFTPMWVSLDARRDRYFVRQVESNRLMLPLQGRALFAAIYVNEIVHAMVKPHEADSVLYLAYVDALYALSQHPLLLEQALRRFEHSLLEASGHGFSFGHEAYTGDDIKPDCFYQWVPGMGFMTARNGYYGEHLLAFAANQLDEPGVLQTTKRVMRQAMSVALGGKVIHSRALFRREADA